jgi:hypothetical protein
VSRRLVPVLALAATLSPAPASAAPFGALAPLPGDSSCVAATGAPGELVRDAVGAGGEAEPPELVRVGPGGVTPAGALPRELTEAGCPTVAARPDGAAVVAVDKGGIVVAARPAGGSFGPAQMVTGADADHLAVALSARGDALVAWHDAHGIRYVLRPAGGAFGAPAVLTAHVKDLRSLSVGMSSAGEAVVAWSTYVRTYRQLPLHQRVRAAIAPPGGGFAPPRRVADMVGTSAPALAVGDDGRALLALPGDGVVRVAERAPGGRFGPPVALAHARGPLALAVAVGDAGRAAVAWYDFFGRSVGLVTRAATGPFGAPTLLARGHGISARLRVQEALLIALLSENDAAGPFDTGFLALTLTSSGTTASWLWAHQVRGVRSGAVRTAAVPAAGGVAEQSLVADGLHDIEQLTGFPTADGDAGVAWLEPDAGRVRAALPGVVPAADAPAPALHVDPPARHVVRFDEPLVLRVSCSAACDVRGQIGRAGDGELSLPHGGRGRLEIRGVQVAPRRARKVSVRLLYGAPGALHPRGRTLRLRLREIDVAPAAHIRHVRAIRVPGDRIRVTWSGNDRSDAVAYLVTGSATRGGEPLAVAADFGRPLRATLHHVRGIRFVTVGTLGLGPLRLRHPVEVRVR